MLYSWAILLWYGIEKISFCPLSIPLFSLLANASWFSNSHALSMKISPRTPYLTVGKTCDSDLTTQSTDCLCCGDWSRGGRMGQDRTMRNLPGLKLELLGDVSPPGPLGLLRRWPVSQSFGTNLPPDKKALLRMQPSQRKQELQSETGNEGNCLDKVFETLDPAVLPSSKQIKPHFLLKVVWISFLLNATKWALRIYMFS